MSMNLVMRLNGVLLDKLYQTPTDVTYWCLYQRRYFKRNPKADIKRHAPFCSPLECYRKYEAYCWKLAHGWCENHNSYIQEEQHWGGTVFPARIVSKGEQNKSTYDDMRYHLLSVRRLLEAGATFDYI